MPPGERGRKRGWLREPGRPRTRRAARRHRAARSHPGHRCCRSPWQRRQNAVWARTDQGPDGPQKNASKAQRLGRNHHYFKNVKTLSQGFNRKTTRTFLAGGRTDGSRPADGGGGANTAAVQGNRSAAPTGRPRSRQLSATCAGELRAVPRPRQAWLETCFPLGKIKMTQRNGESHRARWGRPRRSGGTCAARPRARGDTVT